MARVDTLKNFLTDIADKFREKLGTTEAISHADYDTKIDEVYDAGYEDGKAEGGEGGEMPEEAFTFTGNFSYRFAYNGWNWYIDNYGHKITTKNLTSATSAFNNATELTDIPFDINFSDEESTIALSYLFSSCNNVKNIADINIGSIGISMASNVYENCFHLRELPNIKNFFLKEGTSSGVYALFKGCYSLREILPNYFSELYKNVSSTAKWTSKYSALYYQLAQRCYSLNKINNIPVFPGEITTNVFDSTFSSTCMLSSVTFETDNGIPLAAQWTGQVISLAFSVGYTSTHSFIYLTNYNSGITLDTEVTDTDTYQTFKNHPDWWTKNVAYSRYNHDSAVETINSLPDTSEYLTTAGGTNTITFKGISGELTDGGAINTLTEEEIAVATAKGWTVTLS